MKTNLKELNYEECLLYMDDNRSQPKKLYYLADTVEDSTKMHYRDIAKIQSMARNYAREALERSFGGGSI